MLATVTALPVGILAVRYDGRLRRHSGATCTNLVLAVPGLVIALSLANFSESHAGFQRVPRRISARAYAGGLWYPTAPMLV